MQKNIVLASSSPYRAQLLTKLGLTFTQYSPDVDESPTPNETPQQLAQRLSKEKAQAVRSEFPESIIIGSDQVPFNPAYKEILHKPMSMNNAEKQLKRCSGGQVVFYTGICVINNQEGQQQIQVDVDTYSVYFRKLNEAAIKHYVEIEKPLNCAGAFKVEGLGIALFERLEGNDYNSLIGLPLIKLTSMLTNIGVNILTPD